MKVYCDIPSYDLKNVPELAKRAEELGFDGISFGELAHDSFLLSTLALEHTKKLKVATGIAIAFARSVCSLYVRSPSPLYPAGLVTSLYG